MWLFSKDSTVAFPYSRSCENESTLLNGWTLYNSVNKKGEEFSVFVHDITNSDVTSKGIIQNALKRMKTLKHPDLINYVDSNESQKEVQIVTEKVVPLDKYLKEKSDSGNFQFIASWGLFQILRGIVFLHKTCKCQHNQIRLASIFVNKSGDWKLGAFDFVTNFGEDAPSSVLQTDLYWPMDKNKIDSYGYGCLIWETFNRNLIRKTDLKEISTIPGQLVKLFQKLIHPKPNMRLNLDNALSEMNGSGGFADNFYVKTLLFLEEIQIKEQEEKQQFMTSLTDLVDSFPDDIAKYKILPHLLMCHQYGAAGIEVLLPLVKLGKLLEPAEFETSVVPRLVAMFKSSNRNTRVRLLEQLPSFVDVLPYKVVDVDIFPAVVLGLVDTNAFVREATIRAVVYLAPKLSQKNLNEILVNHIMNLQLKDEQGGIRANATVCLAKIAHLLSMQTRQTNLLNILLKCTRDPFLPAKLSSVSALIASQHLFLLNDVATKLLPCLSFLTVDPEKEVREQTFKAMDSALSRLKEASQNPENNKIVPLENKEAQNSIGWKNWAVSFIKKSDANVTSNHSASATQLIESSSVQEKNISKKIDIEERNNKVVEKPSNITQIELTDDDNNDEWAPIEDINNFDSSPQKINNKIETHWDSNPDEFFDRLMKESAPPKVVKSKLQLGKKPEVKKLEVKKPEDKKPEVKKPEVKKKSTPAISNEDGWGDVDW